jgi:hypothetical protein
MVGGQSQALSSDLGARYGAASVTQHLTDAPLSQGGIDAVTQRLNEATAELSAGGGLDVAGSQLGEVADALPGALAEKNASLLGDLAQSKPGSMAAIRQAVGSEGQPLADRYQSLLNSRERASNPAALDGALSTVRGQMAGLLETKRNQYSASAAQTAGLAQSFSGKSPSQLLADAQKARSRVALTSERNRENATSSYSRLLDRENMKQTISAELDTATSQFKDYNHLTKLYALLQLYQHLKPPTI